MLDHNLFSIYPVDIWAKVVNIVIRHLSNLPRGSDVSIKHHEAAQGKCGTQGIFLCSGTK